MNSKKTKNEITKVERERLIEDLEKIASKKNKKSINETEMQILRTLINVDSSLSPSDISAISGYTYPAIHKYGKSLKTRRAIEIRKNPLDPRKIEYSITSWGIVLYQNHLQKIGIKSNIDESILIVERFYDLNPSFQVLSQITSLLSKGIEKLHYPSYIVDYLIAGIFSNYWKRIYSNSPGDLSTISDEEIIDILVESTLSSLFRSVRLSLELTIYYNYYKKSEDVPNETSDLQYLFPSVYSEDFERSLKMVQKDFPHIIFNVMLENPDFGKYASSHLYIIFLQNIQNLYITTHRYKKEDMITIINRMYDDDWDDVISIVNKI